MYSCNGTLKAVFAPVCEVPPISLLLQRLQNRMQLAGKHKVLFVGDSLMYQLYHTTHCQLELANMSAFGLHMVQNFYLRSGIPCNAACSQESKPRSRLGPCSGCVTSPYTSELDEKNWLNKLLTNDYYALVISTGAWYNTHKGLADPFEEYKRTHAYLAPRLRDFAARGSKILWVGLPPCGRRCDPAFGALKASATSFGHTSFDSFDEFAAKHIADLNIKSAHFINVSQATWGRKIIDPGSSPDGLHWCNFNTYSVPQLLLSRIFYKMISK
jgi:hypothetical protein